MSLNNEQRNAVCARGNVVVTAGAGSGKTTVLANRVLFLLVHERIDLQNILVLTFTNKAASEMHERIHAQLRQCIAEKAFLKEPLSTAHISFLEEQLLAFERAHISTIDSFLYKIAQKGGIHFGIFGDISITETITSHAHSFIQRYVIQHKDNPILQELIALHGIVRLTEKIYAPLLLNANIFHVPSTLTAQGKHVLQTIRERIPHCREKILHHVQCIRQTLEFAGIQKSCTQNSKSIQKFIKDIDVIEAVATDMTKIKTASENLSHIRLSLQGVTNTKKIKESGVAETLKTHRTNTQNAIEHWHITELTLKHSEWIEQNYKEATALVEAWIAHKKRAMLFSYNDISHLAQKTIETVPIVHTHIASFSHIIVDEVQDNSKEQNRLLESLQDIVQKNTDTAPHFFFVGDPKQSIYKFRGADVQTFVALTENPTMQKHELLHNYRSSSELISFFNEVFSRLFEKIFDEKTSDENHDQKRIRYTAQRADASHVKAREDFATNSHIQFRMLASHTPEEHTNPPIHSKEELEAFSIAQIVQEVIHERQYKAQDIAVLARSSVLFPYLQKAFLMLNIPYEIQTKEASLRQDLGYDFYAWCTLLITPEDSAAYVSVLRGPLANVSDDLVIRIVEQRKNNDCTLNAKNLFIIEEDTNTQDDVLQHDIKRLAIMKELYTHARKLVEKNQLQELLTHFWIVCGYRYVLLRNAYTHPFLKQYHILKSIIASSASKGGITHFIETLASILLEKNENSADGTRVLSEQGEEAVQIMTIHKSKGLEFPVVIVADISRNFGKAHKLRYAEIHNLVYVNFGLPCDSVYALRDGIDNKPENNAIDYAIKQHKESDVHEELRVLYVACTRAKNRLYISGIVPENSVEEHGKINTYYDMLSSIVDDKYTQKNGDIYKLDASLSSAEEAKTYTSISDKEYTKKIEAILENSAHAEKSLQKIKTVFPSDDESFRKEAQIKKDREKLPELSVDEILDTYKLHAAFGELCHEILKHACAGHESRYHQLPVTLEARFLHIEECARSSLITCAEQCAQHFLRSALWTEKEPNARIFTEYKICHCDDTRFKWMSMIIDLIILEKNRCIIVDYKTDLYKNIDKHTLQLEAYAAAVENFLSTRVKNSMDITVIPYVFYLRSGTCQKIKRTMNKSDIFNALASD